MFKDLSSADVLRRIVGGDTNLNETDLRWVDLQGGNLLGVSFRGALLIGADLSDAHISGVDFTGASLVDTNFTSAWFNPHDPPTWVNGAKLERILTTGAVQHFRWTLLETVDELRFRFGCEENSVDLWKENHFLYAERHSSSPEKWAAVTKATLDMALLFSL